MRIAKMVGSIGVAALLFQRQPALAEDGCGKDAAESEIRVAIEPGQIDALLRLLRPSDEQPLKMRPRSIYFFDTCNLDLKKTDVILRARVGEKKGKKAVETTAKRRQENAPGAPSGIGEGVKCEEDRSASSAPMSCSLDHEGSSEDDLRSAIGSGASIAKLFSKEQLELVGLKADAPIWRSVRAFGPIASRTWKDAALGTEKAAFTATVEEWTLHGESKPRFVEVSQRVCQSRAKEALQTLTLALTGQNLELAKQQGAKTAQALQAMASDPAFCPPAAPR